MLYHDKPVSKGVENALKRAAQLVNIQYMPVASLPTSYGFDKAYGERIFCDGFAKPWRNQHGMVYSSVRANEKYVGYNVSIETFMSALANPNSVLYTRNLAGTGGRNMHCYYGIVCSCFVSFVLEIPYRTPCSAWPSMPGVHEVDVSRLENLQLCDIVLNTRRHIAIITDILRDEDGAVQEIAVSESTTPFCACERYAPEQFQRYWLANNYRIYRYDGVHEVTYEPSPFVRLEGDPELPAPEINRTLLPDYGNKANYRLDEAVELTVFDGSYPSIEITGPNGVVRTTSVVGGRAVVHPRKAGFYSACCVDKDRRSASVEWCSVNIGLTLEKAEFALGEPIGIRFQNDAPDTVFSYLINRPNNYNIGRGYIAQADADAGRAVLPGIQEPDEYHMIVIARNRYGAYASKYVYFSVR